eukprot:236311-Hanusia_phi.AAC.2
MARPGGHGGTVLRVGTRRLCGYYDQYGPYNPESDPVAQPVTVPGTIIVIIKPCLGWVVTSREVTVPPLPKFSDHRQGQSDHRWLEINTCQRLALYSAEQFRTRGAVLLAAVPRQDPGSCAM